MTLTDFAKQLEHMSENLDGLTEKFTEKVGGRFIEYAKPRTPVATWLSKRSWVVENNSKSVKIKNVAEHSDGNQYASYWNFGARFQQGTHTLEKAANLTLQDFPEIFQKEIILPWLKT
ncbi:MAG: HK97 gp10 family phage protein [Turicibacter sp.]|nr:HK97 gp10 family phage protein [Turicibacter sp.]